MRLVSDDGGSSFFQELKGRDHQDEHSARAAEFRAIPWTAADDQASGYVDPFGPSEDPFIRIILDLDRWLTSLRNQPEPDQLITYLGKVTKELDLPGDRKTVAQHLVGKPGWSRARAALGDSLVAALLDPASEAQDYVRLTRLLLVAGLVERCALKEPRDAAAVQLLLTRRTILLPPGLFPFTKVRPGRALARRPGFADLWVVRDEWSCYVPGEITHVENALRGEFRERVYRRTDETEVTVTDETETTTLNEHELQNTDRFELQSETSRETELAVSVEGQVTTSGQYGPTKVDTHLGGSLDYSLNESSRQALAISKEVVERSLQRVEQRVRRQQVTRTLARVEETNTHRLDNAENKTDSVTGVYRWVDKIQRYQLFRYPHRYLLEFQIPEPAAYLHWLNSEQAPKEHGLAPVPFTVDGTENGAPLSAAMITPDNYRALGARYRVSGLTEPPDEQAVAVALELVAPDKAPGDSTGEKSKAPPKIVKSEDVVIPEGYQAIAMRAASGATRALGTFSDYPGKDGNSALGEASGYHFVWGQVSFAGTDIPLWDGWVTGDKTTIYNKGDFQDQGLVMMTSDLVALKTPCTSKAKLAVIMAGTFKSIVSVNVVCRPLPATVDRWRNNIFDKLAAAYEALDRDFQRMASAEMGARSLWSEQIPPLRAAELVREELKRQVIELLLAGRFDGVDALIEGTDDQRPRPEFATAIAEAPFIQFLEQAFEWSNLTYVCYPYFWAGRQRWAKLQPLTGTDPEFIRFLRSGSARVVVPARPGFEDAVNVFLYCGRLWGGGSAPAPDEELYISVAKEIQELTGAPDQAEAGESWEKRLPTTLVWLDPDPALPKENDNRRLAEPADPICAHEDM
ncbi:hypothetical protein LDL08_25295 [Nonomuraea glycinis]|uniref:Uncharacterized protein n=1 Tax=Nonomuraea glycinis TaxID=2047744 RepID=A0A918EAI9_9ACTN|nr:hypothetical protein [Nonomuraea glycinis]MCA2179508.1 hypothetical protein [Nonomuraea glycinis]GGP15499.1 hypothetical protein GCM10012278_75610 [Nonomuraea glycinis]